MPDRNQKVGNTAVAAFSVLVVMTIILSVSASPLAAQSTVTIVYGNGTKLLVRDWNFVYAFLDGDNPAYLHCNDEGPCGTIKTSQDLHLVNSSTGSTPPVQEFAIFWKDDLQAIRIRWKTNNLGAYESDGVTLNRNRDAPRYESEGVTIVTTRGTEYHFEGGLLAPDPFLSHKKYVRQLFISVFGKIPGDQIELPLDRRLSASSPKDRIDEILFQ